MLTEFEIYLRLARNTLGHKKSSKVLSSKEVRAIETDQEYVDYIRRKKPPILPDSEEVIKRKDWDLDGLVGASEKQVYHPHFEVLKQHFFETFRPKHKIAFCMLCSNAKPYYDSAMISGYMKACQGKADMYILSNPGVIPIEHSNMYPFRYYEWNETLETPESKAIYLQSVYDRTFEWFTHFHYDHLFCCIKPGETSDALARLGEEGLLQIPNVIDQAWLEMLLKIYPQFRNIGLVKMRSLNMKETKAKFHSMLNSYLGQVEGKPRRDLTTLW